MPDDNAPAAYNEFMERRAAQMTGLARSVLWVGNCTDPDGHTEEVVQEVRLRVLKSWKSLRSPDDALNTITANAARTHARTCRREAPQEISDGEVPCFSSGVVDPTEIYEQGILIEELLSQLEEMDQKIIFFRFQDLSHDEIASLLGVSSGTIRSRYSRAVEKLRRAESKLAHEDQNPIVVDPS
jgi:RNA polymerase sigma factor (sigma-70 family)